MGKYKDENGTTRIGDALRSLGDVAKPILSAAGDLTGQEWLSSVANGIRSSKDIAEEQKNYLLELHAQDVQDRISARTMNVEIQKSEHASWLAKNTGYIIDMSLLALLFGIVIGLFTVAIPETNENTLYMVLGMVMGFVGASITFHRGSSEGSKSKTMEMFKTLTGKK